jgi:transposase-like protein
VPEPRWSSCELGGKLSCADGGVAGCPNAAREKPKKFKKYEIDYFHIDIAEPRYEGGKGFLYVAVDRTSKLVFACIYRRATKLAAAAFLRVLNRTVPTGSTPS